MRIWSLHPQYLDSRGLVAVWRETLLAQAVLRGQTRGYKHHPQLNRFQARKSPVGSIARYLRGVCAEAQSRGYNFAAEKIAGARDAGTIPVTRGQIEYEWRHLMAKLEVRDPERRLSYAKIKIPETHPLFRVVPGPVAPWEKVAAPARG